MLQADVGRDPGLIPVASRTAAALALVLGVLPACGTRGLDFVKDERVVITAPRDRAKITLPVTIAWSVHGFEVSGPDGRRRRDAGYFGVYVDRPPQPPERTQAWLVRDDQRCTGDPACPDREFLATLNVHSTTETRFTIARLPAPSSEAARRREFHEATVVLLNGRGERIGESAFTVQFEVAR